MVAEQRETVQRIDADTMDIATNVSGAQRELMKYYASISSNRWLMLKVFGVLIVFVSSFSFLAETEVVDPIIAVPRFYSCFRLKTHRRVLFLVRMPLRTHIYLLLHGRINFNNIPMSGRIFISY